MPRSDFSAERGRGRGGGVSPSNDALKPSFERETGSNTEDTEDVVVVVAVAVAVAVASLLSQQVRES